MMVIHVLVQSTVLLSSEADEQQDTGMVECLSYDCKVGEGCEDEEEEEVKKSCLRLSKPVVAECQ